MAATNFDNLWRFGAKRQDLTGSCFEQRLAPSTRAEAAAATGAHGRDQF